MTLSRLSPRDTSRGFSLIELAVVVAIIGILAAIAIPTFLGQRESAQDAQAKSALRNVAAEARALAAQQDAAGFPEDLLAEMAGLQGLAAFPGPDSAALVAAIYTAETSYRLITEPDSSTDPNEVWVMYHTPITASYAARSESGKCWYLFDLLTNYQQYGAGFHWFYDNNPETRADCGQPITIDEAQDLLTPREDLNHEVVAGGDDNPEAPEHPENPLDVYCEVSCLIASMWGDPHIVTFDGLGYEFHVTGEYTAIQTLPALSGADPLIAQIRTDSLFDNDRVSYLTGFALQIGEDGTTLTLTPGADPLRINAEAIHLEEGQFYTFGTGLDGADLDAGYVTLSANGTYEILGPSLPGEQVGRVAVEIRVYSSFLDVNFGLPRAYAELVEGLWGNADEDAAGGPYDDLRVNGAEDPLHIPVSNHVIHNSFAPSWAVDDPSDSLFDANGHGYLARDPSYPERFQADVPVPPFAGYDEAEVAAAIAACAAEGVHPYLQPACALDSLAAGGNVTLRDAARRGAVAASTPRLMNSYDDWSHILTFGDGAAPTTKGWTLGGSTGGTLGLNTTYVGSLIFSDTTSSNYFRSWCRAGVVTEDFTYQADVRVEANIRSGNAWHWQSGYTQEGFGMAVSDGTDAWWVRVMPASIADGNDPTKVFSTNASTRSAQVRFSKKGSVVSLYVDGHYAFDLTPGEQTDLKDTVCATNPNFISFGHMIQQAGGGRGVIHFDNIAYSPNEAKEDLGMNIWSPKPWSHIMHFADVGDTPLAYGWRWQGQEGILSISMAVEDGALQIEDNYNGAYYRGWWMPHVVTEDFTFQADIRAPGRSNGHTTRAFGMAIDDGTNRWWVSFAPYAVTDGEDATKIYATNLYDRTAQVRIVKEGDTAKLYVDGEYAFDLTPGEPVGNRVSMGMMFGDGGVGKVLYDNVMFAGTAADLPAMPNWTSWTWLQTLDFEDGQSPVTYGWVQQSSNQSAVITDGVFSITDTRSSSNDNGYYHRQRLNDVVTEDFTFQADINVPSYIKAVGDNANGHTADSMGMLMADGTNMWWVRVGPTWVADGNEPADTTSKRHMTDLFHRYAQIRIAKEGNTAKLYVDGAYIFDLTPVPADTWGNALAFGHIPNAQGIGRIIFDNVQFTTKALGGVLMTPWTPNPWAQTVESFGEGHHPGSFGWGWNGPASQLGTSRTNVDGVFVLHDTSGGNAGYYNRYVLNHAVTDNLTWEMDVQIDGAQNWTADGQGMLIADGAQSWWVQFRPDQVRDGHGAATHAIDLTASPVTIRLEKDNTTVSLYVNDAYAFDLTSGGVSSWNNSLAFGQVGGANGVGRMMFHAIRVGP